MLKKPVNLNYCATIVEIKNLIPLPNCDNVQSTVISGYIVLIDKSIKIGDIGIFFTTETELSKEFLSNNNIYRHSELNIDKEKKGYFEDNGRIRCVKFRGNPSMGFYVPLHYLDFTKHTETLNVGDEFDEINNIPICKKYIVKRLNSSTSGSRQAKKEKVSKILEGQFKFHIDTVNLNKVYWKLQPDTLISITTKKHGTSCISSKILCKKKLNLFEKLLKLCGINIVDTEYDNIWSSRRVIKNDDLNPVNTHFYSEDIWGVANREVREHLVNGLTLYYEIVGFLSDASFIQKPFDYGCAIGTHKLFIYRITYTNDVGQVFEFSAKQVQEWCKLNGLDAVPELYYGTVRDLYSYLYRKHNDTILSIDFNSETFLELLRLEYLEKDCPISKNKVPDEGIVIRIENMFGLDVMKYKSLKFLEFSTIQMDNSLSDIEDMN